MANLGTTFEKQVTKLLAELAPRARSVLKLRYGIGREDSLTLEAIGKKEGITRERVRQIESDAMRKLKASTVFATLAEYESILSDAIDREGGIVSEDGLFSLPELAGVKDRNSLLFFADLADSLVRRKADGSFHVRWCTKLAPAEKIEAAILACAKDLEKSKTTHGIESLYKHLNTRLAENGIGISKPAALASYVELSKEISQSPWGEYGHVSSSFVRPRGMRESAFVTLARAESPLHFREIARRIGEFSKRRVHVQTVHNELIKDKRFVLVGRGLYALREWGYEPGFIRDVLVRVLKEKGPLTREEILAEVSKRRQVKPSTVLINLQNKRIFKSLDNGSYTLIS